MEARTWEGLILMDRESLDSEHGRDEYRKECVQETFHALRTKTCISFSPEDGHFESTSSEGEESVVSYILKNENGENEAEEAHIKKTSSEGKESVPGYVLRNEKRENKTEEREPYGGDDHFDSSSDGEDSVGDSGLKTRDKAEGTDPYSEDVDTVIETHYGGHYGDDTEDEDVMTAGETHEEEKSQGVSREDEKKRTTFSEAQRALPKSCEAERLSFCRRCEEGPTCCVDLSDEGDDATVTVNPVSGDREDNRKGEGVEGGEGVCAVDAYLGHSEEEEEERNGMRGEFVVGIETQKEEQQKYEQEQQQVKETEKEAKQEESPVQEDERAEAYHTEDEESSNESDSGEYNLNETPLSSQSTEDINSNNTQPYSRASDTYYRCQEPLEVILEILGEEGDEEGKYRDTLDKTEALQSSEAPSGHSSDSEDEGTLCGSEEFSADSLEECTDATQSKANRPDMSKSKSSLVTSSECRDKETQNTRALVKTKNVREVSSYTRKDKSKGCRSISTRAKGREVSDRDKLKCLTSEIEAYLKETTLLLESAASHCSPKKRDHCKETPTTKTTSDYTNGKDPEGSCPEETDTTRDHAITTTSFDSPPVPIRTTSKCSTRMAAELTCTGETDKHDHDPRSSPSLLTGPTMTATKSPSPQHATSASTSHNGALRTATDITNTTNATVASPLTATSSVTTTKEATERNLALLERLWAPITGSLNKSSSSEGIESMSESSTRGYVTANSSFATLESGKSNIELSIERESSPHRSLPQSDVTSAYQSVRETREMESQYFSLLEASMDAIDALEWEERHRKTRVASPTFYVPSRRSQEDEYFFTSLENAGDNWLTMYDEPGECLESPSLTQLSPPRSEDSSKDEEGERDVKRSSPHPPPRPPPPDPRLSSPPYSPPPLLSSPASPPLRSSTKDVKDEGIVQVSEAVDLLPLSSSPTHFPLPSSPPPPPPPPPPRSSSMNVGGEQIYVNVLPSSAAPNRPPPPRPPPPLPPRNPPTPPRLPPRPDSPPPTVSLLASLENLCNTWDLKRECERENCREETRRASDFEGSRKASEVLYNSMNSADSEGVRLSKSPLDGRHALINEARATRGHSGLNVISGITTEKLNSKATHESTTRQPTRENAKSSHMFGRTKKILSSQVRISAKLEEIFRDAEREMRTLTNDQVLQTPTHPEACKKGVEDKNPVRKEENDHLNERLQEARDLQTQLDEILSGMDAMYEEHLEKWSTLNEEHYAHGTGAQQGARGSETRKLTQKTQSSERTAFQDILNISEDLKHICMFHVNKAEGGEFRLPDIAPTASITTSTSIPPPSAYQSGNEATTPKLPNTQVGDAVRKGDYEMAPGVQGTTLIPQQPGVAASQPIPEGGVVGDDYDYDSARLLRFLQDLRSRNLQCYDLPLRYLKELILCTPDGGADGAAADTTTTATAMTRHDKEKAASPRRAASRLPDAAGPRNLPAQVPPPPPPLLCPGYLAGLRARTAGKTQ